jgi:hypothetical protein
MNTEFSYKILALQKEVKEKENALQNKAAEVDALNYTIKLWENRRLAAQEAGHVTIEDIVADKIKYFKTIRNFMKNHYYLYSSSLGYKNSFKTC